MPTAQDTASQSPTSHAAAGGPGPRRPHPFRQLLAAAALALLAACQQLPPQPPAASAEIQVSAIDMPWEDLRLALEDAIAAEGLTAPTVSHFGDMLARTAPDLGHRADLYTHAEILSFCSVGVAARLVTEAAEQIALCPLSIAVYALPGNPGRSYLAYRRPPQTGAGSAAAEALMRRLVKQAAEGG